MFIAISELNTFPFGITVLNTLTHQQVSVWNQNENDKLESDEGLPILGHGFLQGVHEETDWYSITRISKT